MLATIPVLFDFHHQDGGRLAFAEWLRESGGEAAVTDPAFSYLPSYAESIEHLRSLSRSQSDIYLSNVVGHASVLTTRPSAVPDSGLALEYDDVESLIRSPKISGYREGSTQELATALAPLHDWQVVGSFNFPEECGLKMVESAVPSLWKSYLQHGWEPLGAKQGVMVCRLADPSTFATIGIDIAFIIPPSVSLDVDEIADRYSHERLREYLLRRRIPFGTLGDCHMDDSYAVSYLEPVFDYPNTHRCFIR